MADGIFIKILPQLELTALAAVMTQLKSLMGKASGDISAAFDKNEAEIQRLTDATVRAANESSRAQIAAYKAAGEAGVAAAREVEVANSKAAESTKARAALASNVAGMRSGQASDEAAQKAEKAAAANKALAEATDGVTAASVASSKAFNVMGGGAALVAGAMAVGGVESAKKYEFGLASLAAKTDQSAASMKTLHDGLLQVSAATGASLDQLTQASTLVAKAGPNFQDAASNLKLVSAAAQLAAIEGTGLDNSMKAILFTMKDFSFGMGDVVNVASMLRAGAGDAAVSIDELAGSLHNVEPIMKLLTQGDPGKGKMMFGQMTALVAQGTQGGMSADQTTDLVNNTVMNLVSGSGNARTMYGALGGGSYEDLQKSLTSEGPIPTMQKMYDLVQSRVIHGGSEDGLVKVSDTFNSVDQKNVLQKMFTDLSPDMQAKAQGIQDGTLSRQDMNMALREGPDSARLRAWYTQRNKVQSFDPVMTKFGSDYITPEQAMQGLTNNQSGLKIMSQDFGTADSRAAMAKTQSDTMNAKGDNNGQDVSGWAKISETLKIQLDQMKRSMTDCAITIGEALLPALKGFVDTLKGLFDFFNQHKIVLDALLTLVGAMALKWVALKAAMQFGSTFELLTAGFGGVATKGGEAATAAEKVTGKLGGLTTGLLGMIGPLQAATIAAMEFYQHHDPSDYDPSKGIVHTLFGPVGDWFAGNNRADDLARANGFPDANQQNVYNADRTGDKHGRPALPGSLNKKPGIPLNDGGGYDPTTSATPGPTGASNDPVTVTIPGLDQAIGAGGPGTGGGDGSGDSGGLGGLLSGSLPTGVKNPLQDSFSGKGGFIGHIVQFFTTFLAEMALGNPLGHLMTMGQGGADGGQDSGIDTTQLGDLSKMSAGERKKAEYQIKLAKAKREFEIAQRAYVAACTKYGSGSKQALDAYDREANAMDNLDAVGMSEQDSAQTAVQKWMQANAALQGDTPGSPKYAQDKAKADQLAGQIPSGATATDSSGNPVALPGGGGTNAINATDASVLSQMGKGGHYVPGGADLSKGLADCSGAVASLVKIYEGANINDASTKTHDFTTGPGEGAWLKQHGFLPTNVPMPGTLQVGYNGEHTQATMPGGSNINYGNDKDVANGGLAPNSGGAWMPGFDQHFYRPNGGGGAPAAPASSGWPLKPASTTAAASGGAYNPLSPSQLTNPGLSNPTVSGPTGGGQGFPLPWKLGSGDPNNPGIPPGMAGEYPATGLHPAMIPGGGLPGAQMARRGLLPNGVPARAGAQNQAKPVSPGTGEGFKLTGGGLIGLAEKAPSMAASAAGSAGSMFGGGAASGAADAAMQIGMEELNRLAGYIGQVAGIGVEGLAETFRVSDPDGGGGGKSGGGWLSKLAGGMGGASKSAPNAAGGTAAGSDPQQKDPTDPTKTAAAVKPKDDPNGGPNSKVGAAATNVNITNNNHQVTDPGGVAAKTTQAFAGIGASAHVSR